MSKKNIKKILLKQIIKYSIVGILNTFIDFFVLNIEMLITGITSGIYMILLNSISFICALINSYFLNKNWTFCDKNHKKQDQKFLHFFFVSLFSIIINNIIVYTITTYTSPVFSISSIKRRIIVLLSRASILITVFFLVPITR